VSGREIATRAAKNREKRRCKKRAGSHCWGWRKEAQSPPPRPPPSWLRQDQSRGRNREALTDADHFPTMKKASVASLR
jgi:hypothetical protein